MSLKRHAPAAARNAQPIAAVLAQELPPSGLVLEVASGTGQHAVHFARRFPRLQWQPSDAKDEALASIAAWREDAGPANLLRPIRLDASAPVWPMSHADAILCINMVHISPWSATQGMFIGAAKILPPDAPLILYGPFIEPEVAIAPSNVAFDADLKARNHEWGLRNSSEVDDLANGTGFARSCRYPMPANNIMLVYRRRS